MPTGEQSQEYLLYLLPRLGRALSAPTGSDSSHGQPGTTLLRSPPLQLLPSDHPGHLVACAQFDFVTGQPCAVLSCESLTWGTYPHTI